MLIAISACDNQSECKPNGVTHSSIYSAKNNILLLMKLLINFIKRYI